MENDQNFILDLAKADDETLLFVKLKFTEYFIKYNYQLSDFTDQCKVENGCLHFEFTYRGYTNFNFVFRNCIKSNRIVATPYYNTFYNVTDYKLNDQNILLTNVLEIFDGWVETIQIYAENEIKNILADNPEPFPVKEWETKYKPMDISEFWQNHFSPLIKKKQLSTLDFKMKSSIGNGCVQVDYEISNPVTGNFHWTKCGTTNNVIFNPSSNAQRVMEYVGKIFNDPKENDEWIISVFENWLDEINVGKTKDKMNFSNTLRELTIKENNDLRYIFDYLNNLGYPKNLFLKPEPDNLFEDHASWKITLAAKPDKFFYFRIMPSVAYWNSNPKEEIYKGRDGVKINGGDKIASIVNAVKTWVNLMQAEEDNNEWSTSGWANPKPKQDPNIIDVIAEEIPYEEYFFTDNVKQRLIEYHIKFNDEIDKSPDIDPEVKEELKKAGKEMIEDIKEDKIKSYEIWDQKWYKKISVITTLYKLGEVSFAAFRAINFIAVAASNINIPYGLNGLKFLIQISS